MEIVWDSARWYNSTIKIKGEHTFLIRGGYEPVVINSNSVEININVNSTGWIPALLLLGGENMSGKNSGDNQYTSLIFISLALLVIIGLSLGSSPESSGELFKGSGGNDLIPSVSDLNPGVTQQAKAENIAFGNYVFYFEDPGFSFSGLGVMIFGFLSNLFFEAAVLTSKLLSLFLNLTMSPWVASIGGWILKFLGNGSANFLTTVFYIMMPIAYGSWAIWTGLAQKKYVVALTGILGAIMLYAVGSLMLTQGEKVLTGMTSTSSQLAKGFMTLGSSGSKGDPNIVINDDIWLSQIYIPWSVNQFGTPGVSTDLTKMRDSNGSPITSIPMNPWEEKELNGYKDDETFKAVNITDDWVTTLLGQIELNAYERSAVQDVLNDPDNPRVQDGWKPSAGSTALTTFFLMIVNLLQFVIIGIPSLIVILADIILVIALIIAHIVFFISLVPNYGTKVYKAYLNIIISSFVAKILYGVISGLYISSITATYLGMYSAAGGKTYSIIIAGLTSILISLGFVALLWLLWKKVGMISIGTFAANAATGNWSAVREQWGDFRERHSFDMKEQLMNGRYTSSLFRNDDVNKYIWGLDTGQLLSEELSELKSKRAMGNFDETDTLRLEKLLQTSGELQSKTVGKKREVFERTTNEAQKFKVHLFEQEFEALEKDHRSGNISNVVYSDKKSELWGTLDDMKERSNDGGIRNMLEKVENKFLESESLNDLNGLENYLAKNSFDQMSTKQRSEFLALVEETKQNASQRIHGTQSGKTQTALEKIINSATKYRNQLFEYDLSRVSESGKLEFLRNHFDDEQLGAYAHEVYNRDKLKLLDKAAETLAGSQQHSYWRSELEHENMKPDDLRDNRIIEYTRGKLEGFEFDKIAHQSQAAFSGSDVVFSTQQLSSFTDDVHRYLDEIAVSGEYKQKAESFLSNAATLQSINELSLRNPAEEIAELTKMLKQSVGVEQSQLISSRLIDVKSNEFKSNLLEQARNSKIDFSEIQATLQKELSNAVDSISKETISRQINVAEMISKDLNGYLGKVEPSAPELRLLGSVEQMSQDIAKELHPFAQTIKEKIETQTINEASNILSQMKTSMMNSLSFANEELQRELQPKFEYLTTICEEADKLNQVAATQNNWNFDEGNNGFQF